MPRNVRGAERFNSVSRFARHRTRFEWITEAVGIDHAPSLTSRFGLHGEPQVARPKTVPMRAEDSAEEPVNPGRVGASGTVPSLSNSGLPS